MKINNDNICIDIIDICVSELLDKHADERGLFRSTVPQVDVRSLQDQILTYLKEKEKESSSDRRLKQLFSAIKDSDPYSLAEVIQTSLKEMKHPLFFDVYTPLLELELVENNFDHNIRGVKTLLEKVSEPKFTLIKKIFFLLAHLISLEENDASIVQLAHVISPTICRPITSAFMSLRHMEDLKRIRPIVLFLMENCHDIFEGLSSKSPSPGAATKAGKEKDALLRSYYQDSPLTGSSSTANNSIITPASEPQTPPGVPRLNLSIDLGKPTGSEDIGFSKPNLLVTIPGSSGEDSESSNSSGSGGSGGTNGSSEMDQKAYSDNEWKILNALINSRVASFTSLNEKETAFFISNEQQNESYFSAMQSHLVRSMQLSSPSKDITLSPSSTNNGAVNSALLGMANLSSPNSSTKFGGSSLSPSGMSLSSPNTLKSLFFKEGEGQSKSIIRRNNRRRLVSVCRSLRTQIQDFEENFKKENDRMPKGNEKGDMTQTYSRYRELKKEIREGSATDLQRVFRGYLARIRFRSANSNAPGSASAPASLGSTTQVSPLSSPPSAGPSSEEQLLLQQYREYSESKKDLKKKLKKFDEDFETKHHKPPVKSDKEVIRPLYQKYHDIKKRLDGLKKTLLAMNASIPDDLLEEIHGASAVSGANATGGNILAYSNTFTVDASSGMSVASGASVPSSGSKKPQHLSVSTSYDSKDDELLFASSASNTPTSSSGAPGSFSSTSSISSTSASSIHPSERDAVLEGLMQEKKTLHMYLKLFERNFLKQNARPVTRSEDISPVATEYQRYKEIKALIAELKAIKKSG